MFEIDVVCSDPKCGEEEFQVWVEDPSEVEAVVCECGHAVVTLRVAVHEPEMPVLLHRVRAPEPDPIAA
ncbi:MAG TPA: hypothetical protein VLL27_12635 [Solirubrobacterales bacterium]|nr:hypothetical protein [Solirubrobacterales bacterium]